MHQKRRIIYEVEQVTEPAGGIPSRPAVQLDLHLPYREVSRVCTRPRHGAGIHWRIFGHCLPSLTDTLPPFPVCRAFPGPEYYGGSVPTAPSAGVAPIPPPPPPPGNGFRTHPGRFPRSLAVRSTG